MVGGNYYKIFAGFFPAGLLGLVAEDENINIEELGYFIEHALTVFSSPD